MPMVEQTTKLSSYRFDQLADQINERVIPTEAEVERYVGLEHLDSDSLQIRRWGEPSEVESTKLRFQPGDIIFGKRRVYQRKVAVADTEGICSAHAMVLRARPEVVLPELFPYFMQSDVFMERALRISVGSLSPTINWKALAKEQFALPPREDQRQLAEVLSALRTALERIEDTLNTLERTQTAFIEDFLVRRHGNAPMVCVSELLTEGPRNGASPKGSNSEDGFRTVSISAISQGAFNPEGCIKFVEIEPTDAAAFLVREGDTYVVRGNGNRNWVGRIGLCTKSYLDLIYPDKLMLLRFDESVMLKEFAVMQWNHPCAHTRLTSRAKGSNGIWMVNGQDIRAHTLTVPKIEAQREAVRVLSHLQSERTSMQKRRTQLLHLQQLFHEQAFGQV